MKILCLGNEFIKEDSFAKEVCSGLTGFDIVNIKDSFELLEILKREKEVVIVDVVLGLKDIRLVDKEDLRQDSILSAHDFDAGFLISL